MDNYKYNSYNIKHICEHKLDIIFRSNKEFNGWFMLDKLKKARITIPKGRKSISKGTYRSMAKQLYLSIKQFDNLLGCPLDKDDYMEILQALNK